MNIEYKAEQALKSLLESAGVTPTVYTGHDYREMEIPRIKISARSSEELSPGSGTFRVQLNIELRTQFDSADNRNRTIANETAHQGYVEEYRNATRTTTFSTDLSAAYSGFHCFSAILTNAEHGIEDRHYLDTESIQLVCVGADVG